ncbi:glycolate dehydrogenase, FAD-binding subunit glcE [Limimaricola cinnabarinus LL-001]|uniref:Glycolate dehydrogenase, FAD-binding subunit glcE n=1 Tax=Limimaricola cinnabarinus LL-001 TaxID=1337093 RepID=U2Z100_9RHOB|nr:glycolate dehydrogenase, FAD-binding subunit glcE [Limimaricola cinnabarinus LL-001]
MIRPGSEAELAEAVRDASGPLSVRGGGTRGLLPEGTPLTTSGLSGIVLHDPAALTLVALAGTPVEEIDATLARANQRLAFEPMDHRALLGTKGTPTIGGVVAANVSGPRRMQVGAARDHLLGLRFVDGEGTIVKNGGRVMKNVTGYDLARLLAGSRGALGVITEVALKVLPGTETTANLVIHGLDDATAVRAMSDALGTPFEVSGAAHDPHAPDGPRTELRLEGFGASVAYRCQALAERLKAHGSWETETDRDAVRAHWRGIRDAARSTGGRAMSGASRCVQARRPPSWRGPGPRRPSMIGAAGWCGCACRRETTCARGWAAMMATPRWSARPPRSTPHCRRRSPSLRRCSA